jgi:hypothetical protein
MAGCGSSLKLVFARLASWNEQLTADLEEREAQLGNNR